MKRGLLIILTGLLCGALAHYSWFDARRPESAGDLEEQLKWVRATLRLNADQYAQIKHLHEELGPQLISLASEVQRMRVELALFENERVTSGQIDFLEFARFIEEQREIDRNYGEYSRRLVTATTSVMTPEQRAHYLDIVAPAINSVDRNSYQ